MSDLYAAYSQNNRWPAGGAEPRAGLRRGDGNGNWVEVSEGLRDHIEGLAGTGSLVLWAITDMWFVQGALMVTWWDDRSANSGVSMLVGNTWRHLITAENSSTIFAGFICWNRKPYIYGQSAHGYFAIWEIDGTEIKPYMEDTNYDARFSMAWRGCCVMSPTLPNVLVMGDAYNDRFAYADLKAKTFHAGSDPSGCCIFAMGIDNDKLIWCGDYGNYFYGSWDGGHTFERTGGFGGEANEHGLLPDVGLPELWEMKRWKGNLYGVGCNPCAIVRRNATTTHTQIHFETVAHFPELGSRDGVGFMSFQPVGSDLVIGFGAESFYYQVKGGPPGRVYRYVNGELRDISGGLYWGTGVHQVCDRTRSCSGGILTGTPDDHGVRYDNSLDRSGRLLSGR